MSEDTFTTYRFIRVDGPECNFFPVVTVRFDVDRKEQTLHCWWAICNESDQFSKKEGKNIVDKRATTDSAYYICLTYFPKKTLAYNFKMAVQFLVEDDSLYQTTTEFLYKNLFKLNETIQLVDRVNRLNALKEASLNNYDVFDKIFDKVMQYKDKAVFYMFKLRGWV